MNSTTKKENAITEIMSTIGITMKMIKKTCDCRAMYEYANKMMNTIAKMINEIVKIMHGILKTMKETTKLWIQLQGS